MSFEYSKSYFRRHPYQELGGIEEALVGTPKYLYRKLTWFYYTTIRRLISGIKCKQLPGAPPTNLAFLQSLEAVPRRELHNGIISTQHKIPMTVIIPYPALEGMPLNVFEYILELWAQSEWFAPAIAERISRRTQAMTLATPRAYANLYIHRKNPMMPNHIRTWLARAGRTATRIIIEGANSSQTTAALYGATNAKLLVYQVQEIRDSKGDIIDAEPIDYEALRTCQQLHYLRIIGRDWFDPCRARPFRFDVDKLRDPLEVGSFGRLTALHLISIDLVLSTDRNPCIFPHLLQLQLYNVRGDIDAIINTCSETLEDLRISKCNHELEMGSFLPRLRILCLEQAGDIVDVMELPSLKVLSSAAGELHLSPNGRPLPSVTQWTSARTDKSDLEEYTIRILLRLLPCLECLVLCESLEVIARFFNEFQVDSSLCPLLKCIRVTEGVSSADMALWMDEQKDVLNKWMSSRSGNIEIEYMTAEEYDQVHSHYRLKVRSMSYVLG